MSNHNSLHETDNSEGIDQISSRMLPGVIDLIAKGRVDVKKLIAHRLKFEQSNEAFVLVRQGRSDVSKVMSQGVQ